MARILGVSSILLFLVWLPGCSRDISISPSNVMVRGDVYRHGGGGIQVCLSCLGVPLSGADVSVNGHRLHELPTDGMYLVTQTSMSIEPGVTYELTVRVGENSFSGSAVLCDSFYCLRPEPSSEHRVGEPLLAEWTSTGNDYRYVVLIEQNFVEVVRQTYVSPVLQDTFLTIPAEAFDESGSYWIIIFSFQNGVTYHSCDAVAVDRENLTRGALGFFGSCRLVETRVWVNGSG